MSKNHEPTIGARIARHFADYADVYMLATVVVLVLSGAIVLAVADAQLRGDQRAAQQACVLHGKVPAEVYGKIICVAPEALR